MWAANHKENTNITLSRRLLKRIIILTIIACIILLLDYVFIPRFLKKVVLQFTLFSYLFTLFAFILDSLLSVLKKSLRITIKAIYAVFSVILMFVLLVQVIVPSIIFSTYFAEEEYNELRNISSAEEVTLQSNDGILSGWFLHNEEGAAPLILYFGGNGENSSIRILRTINESEYQEAFEGYNIAFIDYPGYGKSDGSPTGESLKEYGLSVYDAMAARNDVTDIVVLAFSIGTGIGNYVASQRLVEHLILLAPYADGDDLYNNFLDIFYGPVSSLITYHMEASEFARHISATPLIIASRDDEIVSYSSSEQLSKAYPNGCTFITLEKLGHNEISSSETTLTAIKSYINKH